MKFRSTTGTSKNQAISEAIKAGTAPDGSLYVPETFPKYTLDQFEGLSDSKEIAQTFFEPFFDDDELFSKLSQICRDTFSFKLPLVPTNSELSFLELFHGPTGAFKDLGARFLAQCMGNYGEKRVVLVATSGDTGSAVASAFSGLEDIQVLVLYPKDKVSRFQEQQLTYWQGNIHPIRVRGDFDDCQRLVKQAFSDGDIKSKFNLTSANSINIGRLLPQSVYYIFAALTQFRKNEIKSNFIIPTGNMGNSLAAIWARKLGFPINSITLACNSNDTIPKYFANYKYVPQKSVETLANAMDVGNPSNMERFIDLQVRDPQISYGIDAFSVDDETIRRAIKNAFSDVNKVICPHTATAYDVSQRLKLNNPTIISTAAPYKFKETIEETLEITLKPPENLLKYENSQIQCDELNANYSELVKFLDKL